MELVVRIILIFVEIVIFRGVQFRRWIVLTSIVLTIAGDEKSLSSRSKPCAFELPVVSMEQDFCLRFSIGIIVACERYKSLM